MRKSLEQKAEEAHSRTRWKSQCGRSCPLWAWCDPVNDDTRGAALYSMCYNLFMDGYRKGYRQHQKESKTKNYENQKKKSPL